ncbi:MAG TPA: tRNA (5-methylaminomethyl-2-thiouridine)(34)-methyltransferase MnmD [Bacteroidales bacterium]|jgi:tRNA U34 5-methylaminomethyl-2-thiouridine-forming methyltransferase MnmC|nr:tRNA (5-methylaminomethyl-2-thiouridine)(34)-methyltransferase MnmD [Bacteroidales bacterium]HRS18352.1 tRNA (5-methylaminomethyl-2-thiouridine)(34)-methyltransferase MnmD [Bacteroidales bacterium]
MQRFVVKTSDGSNTLYIPQLQEHYHSTYGAHNESQHIYITNAYNYSTKQTPIILEIGFGTGLNAMNTLVEAIKQKKHTTYICIEKYPLNIDEVNNLQYEQLWEENKQSYFTDIHTCAWGVPIYIHQYFTLLKLNIDIVTIHKLPACNIVYYDAFAPEKQPELWTEEIFARIYACMESQGILTTYCVKGTVRRCLEAIGFTIKKIPGPPNGKREMLRAIKP